MPNYYEQTIKKKKLQGRKNTEYSKIEVWQKKWREAGPVRFAEEVLTCPLDVPIYPDWKVLQTEELVCSACSESHSKIIRHKRFRENGTPYHIILSPEQKDYLIDIWTEVDMAVLVAARGAGKTFVYAVYNCWFISTTNKIEITCMGGSSKQSELVQKYIDDWRYDIPKLAEIINRSLQGIKRYCQTIGRSKCDFPACAPTSARGPHVKIVEIDEACVPSETEIIEDNNKFMFIEKTSQVLTDDGNIGTVTKHFKRPYNGPIVHLVPYFNNIGVRVTPNHPIKVIQRKENYLWKERVFPEPIKYVRKREPRWIKAGELKENDILVSPVPKRKIEDVEISDEKLRLIGYYISEGSVGDHQIYISNKDDEFVKDTVYCIKMEFGKDASITPLFDGVMNVYFTDKEFRSWLLSNCGHLSGNKQIPYSLMGLPDHKLDILINAILRGDGENSLKKTVLHVKSKELVQQFWLIFASRGILTTIERDKYGYYVWRLWKKQKSQRDYGKVINGNFYVPIRKITITNYVGFVHNIKVEPRPSYLVPYISLHNCEAEDKSEDGAKAVAAVQWQTIGKRDTKVLLASTAHYIHGMFYEYMTKPELGFKVYRWSIAKHISGEMDPYKVYTDKEPTHWVPNVWWVTQKDIENKRRGKSDSEWLCEALGGASMASGATLQKKDLDIIICDLCERQGQECEPYKWGKCKLIELANLGVEDDPTKFIIERLSGFDYGVSDAPCALTIIGRKGSMVFVLFNDEQLGLREEEKIDWIHTNCQTWRTWTFIPDPAVAGAHLNEKMEDKGYSRYILDEQEKTARVYNLINFVEKHSIIIPKAFWYLTQSLRKLAWDKNNKIRKVDDHSFDSLCYALVDFRPDEGEDSFFNELLSGKVKMPKIDETYGGGKV